jgi:hypothetical protein
MRRMLLLRRSLLAVTAAACLAPASAQAMPITEVTYDVELEAVADFAHEWHKIKDPRTSDKFVLDAKTRIRAKFEHVTFRNGKLLNQRMHDAPTVTATGSGLRTERSWDPLRQQQHTRTTQCPLSSAHGSMALLDADDAAPPVAGGGESLMVRFSDATLNQWACSDGTLTDLAMFNRPFGEGTFDAAFELPAESIGMGTIIQHVHAAPAHRSPQWCPKTDEWTVSCEFGWIGKVTFTKIEEHKYGFETLPEGQDLAKQVEAIVKGQPPVTPPAPPVPPSTGTPAPPLPPGVFVPKLPGKKATRDGAKLRFPVHCIHGCTATAELRTAKGRKPVRLRFAVPATRAAEPVAVTVPKAARAALRRAKAATLRVVLTPPAGARVRATLAVR